MIRLLRALRTDNVVGIAFVDPVAAAQRWGGAFAQGAIVVTTRGDATPPPERPTVIGRAVSSRGSARTRSR